MGLFSAIARLFGANPPGSQAKYLDYLEQRPMALQEMMSCFSITNSLIERHSSGADVSAELGEAQRQIDSRIIVPPDFNPKPAETPEVRAALVAAILATHQMSAMRMTQLISLSDQANGLDNVASQWETELSVTQLEDLRARSLLDVVRALSRQLSDDAELSVLFEQLDMATLTHSRAWHGTVRVRQSLLALGKLVEQTAR